MHASLDTMHMGVQPAAGNSRAACSRTQPTHRMCLQMLPFMWSGHVQWGCRPISTVYTLPVAPSTLNCCTPPPGAPRGATCLVSSMNRRCAAPAHAVQHTTWRKFVDVPGHKRHQGACAGTIRISASCMHALTNMQCMPVHAPTCANAQSPVDSVLGGLAAGAPVHDGASMLVNSLLGLRFGGWRGLGGFRSFRGLGLLGILQLWLRTCPLRWR